MPVNTQHPEYKRMVDRWKRCRDVADGQDAVHAAGELYLPKLQDQRPEEYAAMVKRTPFYNATWRTISGLNGMLFRKPPKVEVPDAAKEMLDDATLTGVPLQLFVQEVCEEALKVGRVGILTDYPEAAAEGLTLADTMAMNLRPCLCLYRAENIINWKTGRVKNVVVLTQLVLREYEEVAVDEFTTRCEERFRVLDLVGEGDAREYRVRRFKVEEGKDVQIGGEVYPTMQGKRLDYIPFVFASPDGTTPEVGIPPLIDLVDLNLSHYRNSADLEHGAHFTGLPTPVVAGYKPDNPEDKLYIGSATAWTFSNPEAHAEFLEFTGQGLGALERLKSEKEKQMAVLGARMLEQQKTGVEKPEAQANQRKGEESTLAAAGQTISLGVTRSLKWFMRWAGQDDKDVSFELNRDFYPVPMTPQMLSSLVSSWQQGAFSDEVLFENLQKGEVVSRETTFEDEQARLEAQEPKLLGQNVDPRTGLPTNQPPALPGKKKKKPDPAAEEEE